MKIKNSKNIAAANRINDGHFLNKDSRQIFDMWPSVVEAGTEIVAEDGREGMLEGTEEKLEADGCLGMGGRSPTFVISQ